MSKGSWQSVLINLAVVSDPLRVDVTYLWSALPLGFCSNPLAPPNLSLWFFKQMKLQILLMLLVLLDAGLDNGLGPNSPVAPSKSDSESSENLEVAETDLVAGFPVPPASLTCNRVIK
ncbi:hypothetical protein Nepgr_018063 [Nepenthes gracilis]|uniref:Uncharacterized protein n=1 Tax=Nepenthes gracilis TaxID=150966 RepID=A0AAD3SSB7_NEPGR|nr:hypothetical protein Nepgr_018063 [Nepenthes gracilis]